MKAISIKQPYAGFIILGIKTIEVRSRPVNYRGEILICSCKKPDNVGLAGYAIGIVEIVDCRELALADIPKTMLDEGAFRELWSTHYAWILKNPRPIKPFPVKGKLSFFNAEIPG